MQQQNNIEPRPVELLHNGKISTTTEMDIGINMDTDEKGENVDDISVVRGTTVNCTIYYHCFLHFCLLFFALSLSSLSVFVSLVFHTKERF